MPHEGMVDALREVHRVLQPGGRLVDLRPTASWPPVDVLGGEGESRAGRLNDSADARDQQACDCALESALERGWFQPLTNDRFMFPIYWDTLQEMLEYITTNWDEVEIPEELVIEAQRLADVAVPPCEIRVQLKMVIATYEKPLA